MSSASRRLFFALWLDEPTRAKLQSAVCSWLPAWRGRALAACDLHVTLCFLGAVPEGSVQPLCDRAQTLPADSIELGLDQVQYWRGSRTLVLTGGQPSAAMQALATTMARIARSVGLTPAAHPLRPHVTLMRSVTEPTRDFAVSEMRLRPPLMLRASSVYLAQSHELGAATSAASEPPRYRLIAQWPLRS